MPKLKASLVRLATNNQTNQSNKPIKQPSCTARSASVEFKRERHSLFVKIDFYFYWLVNYNELNMSMEKYTLLIIGEKGKTKKSSIIKKLIDEGSISKSESNSDENPVTRSLVTCKKGTKFILEITESNFDSVKKLRHLKFDYVLHVVETYGVSNRQKIYDRKNYLTGFVDGKQKYYQTGDIIASKEKHDGYDVYSEILVNLMNISFHKQDDPVLVARCDEYGKPYETDIVKLNNRVSELEAELKTKSEQMAKVKSMLVPTLGRRKFKILVVGDAGVGKSAFIKRHLTGEFIQQYIPDVTMSCLLKFATNYGVFEFDIVDMCGQEKFSHDYSKEKDIDGVIMMYSVASKISGLSVDKHYRPKVIKELGNVTRILCCNKMDSKDCSNYFPVYRKDEDFWEISAKSNYNYEKPFLSFARQFTGKKDLVFTTE